MKDQICPALGPDMSGLVRTCLARDQICPVRIDPLGKLSTSHVSFLGILSNLKQRLTSTLGTTYSRNRTCIEGYMRRSQE
jgi:hypothetical protein